MKTIVIIAASVFAGLMIGYNHDSDLFKHWQNKKDKIVEQVCNHG